MSSGCDHFRDALTALEQGDAGSAKDAVRSGFAFDHPALDEYGGSSENLSQIRTLRAAYEALAGHVVGIPLMNQSPQPLTSADRADIEAAQVMCDDNY